MPQSSPTEGRQPGSPKSHSPESKTSHPKRRARRACLSCRARKVRCNVIEEDPCRNCRLDMVRCVVPRIRRNRKIFSCLLPALTADHEAVEAEKSHRYNEARANVADKILKDTHSRIPTTCHSTHFHTSPAQPSTRQTIYTDDVDPLAHLPSFIAISQKSASPEHIAFLSRQGALDIPTLPLQRALIEAYIEFAYPYMPIIHLEEFLGIMNTSQPQQGYGQKISFLLYQAILFAGSAFVDEQLLERESPRFSTRRLAREELARRVRLLYDLVPDNDSIVMIQASLLMSTWSDVPPDPKDSWYWMGIAVSTAFAAGLNYDPAGRGLSLDQQKVRKRIWWTCYMRDRFLSLGLHRPTRIKDQEFSVPPLESDDFEILILSRDDYTTVGSHCPTLHNIKDQLALAEICTYRAKLGVLIEAVLKLQAAYDYAGRSTSSPELYDRLADQFIKTEEALMTWKDLLPDSCLLSCREGYSRSLNIHRSHLHMMFHTLVYSLHRARFLPTSPRHMNPTPRLLSDISGTKVITSALNISGIVAELRQQGLDTYLPVSGVTIIFPAMVVSLLEMKCKDDTLQQSAARRFKTCMKTMETLQRTYTVADVTISYLNAALSKASIDMALWNSHHDSVDESSAPAAGECQTVSLFDVSQGDSDSLQLTNSASNETLNNNDAGKDMSPTASFDDFEIGDLDVLDLSGLLNEMSSTQPTGQTEPAIVSFDEFELDNLTTFDLSALLSDNTGIEAREKDAFDVVPQGKELVK